MRFLDKERFINDICWKSVVLNTSSYRKNLVSDATTDTIHHFMRNHASLQHLSIFNASRDTSEKNWQWLFTSKEKDTLAGSLSTCTASWSVGEDSGSRLVSLGDIIGDPDSKRGKNGMHMGHHARKT